MENNSKKIYLDWLIIQENYFTSTREFLDIINEKTAREICNDINSSYMFLKSLLMVFNNPNITMKFEKIIIEYALDGNHTHICQAKMIIYSFPAAWKNKKLYELIINYLSSLLDKDDYYVLRNAAQLLKESNQQDYLRLLLQEYCLKSDNIDIKEIYEDYWI